MGRLAILVAALAVLSSFASAEWKFDQNALNGCLCYYSCWQLGGWDCASVWCGYDPKASTSSPACADLSGGPCRCEGFGCGRTQMLTTGSYFEECQKQHARPVCGDGRCEGRKDENCQNCARDCGCFSNAACTGKDPRDERGCTDKCAGVECKPKCDGNTLSTGGECKGGRCEYRTFDCKNGCDNSSWGGARCKPEEDKCKGVVCDGECGWDGIKWDGRCNATSGQCYYLKNATCPKGCAGKDKCVGLVDGVAYYTDTVRVPAGERVPMKRVKVGFEYTDKDGVRHADRGLDDPEYFVWTDDGGRFAWKWAGNFDPEGKLSAYVALDNQDRKLYVSKKSAPSEPWALYWTKNLPVTDRNLTYLDMDLVKTHLANNNGLKACGKVYANMLKAAEYKENVLRKGDTVRERTICYADGGTWHLGEVYEAEAPGESGTSIKSTNSGFETKEAPTNREFHEYCHHIDAEAKNAKINAPGADHAGYWANPDTEWGLIEGWAEYCALMMKKEYGLGRNGDYDVGNTVWNLEANYLIDSKAQPETSEELAIAGILLDLSDSSSDYNGPDDDAVSIWPVEVWNAFSAKREFPDGGNRNVRTLRDLYLALNASGNRYLAEPQPGMNMTKLDYVFLLHNAYQDRDNDTSWDEGEPFGFSGKLRDYRKDLTSEPGTDIVMDVTDEGGRPVPNAYAQITVNYSAPYAHLSRVHLVPIRGGKVAIPMPPESYNATFTVTAVQGGTDNTAKERYTITTKEIYRRIDPAKPLGRLKATIKTAGVPCATDNECIHWSAGTECSNKTKTCQGKAGFPEPEQLDCGRGMRCKGEEDGILGGLGGGLGGGKMPCCSLVGLVPFAALAAALAKSQWLIG